MVSRSLFGPGEEDEAGITVGTPAGRNDLREEDALAGFENPLPSKAPSPLEEAVAEALNPDQRLKAPLKQPLKKGVGAGSLRRPTAIHPVWIVFVLFLIYMSFMLFRLVHSVHRIAVEGGYVQNPVTATDER